VEEGYGPFDEPRTEAEENAWGVWERLIVRRRGDVIHGRMDDVTTDDAAYVLAFNVAAIDRPGALGGRHG
jgi:hypothetical protein